MRRFRRTCSLVDACSVVQTIGVDLLLRCLAIPDTEQTTSLLCSAGIWQVVHGASDRKFTLASCSQENVQLDVIDCANTQKKVSGGVTYDDDIRNLLNEAAAASDRLETNFNWMQQ